MGRWREYYVEVEGVTPYRLTCCNKAHTWTLMLENLVYVYEKKNSCDTCNQINFQLPISMCKQSIFGSVNKIWEEGNLPCLYYENKRNHGALVSQNFSINREECQQFLENKEKQNILAAKREKSKERRELKEGFWKRGRGANSFLYAW